MSVVRLVDSLPTPEVLLDIVVVVVVVVPHGHSKSLTFTAALRADGLTAPLVLDSAMTGGRFRDYVESCLVPTLRPGDVVGMDNVSSHRP